MTTSYGTMITGVTQPPHHQKHKSEIVKLAKEMFQLEKWYNEEYQIKLQELVEKDEKLVFDTKV